MIRWHPFHLLKLYSIFFLIHISPCSSNVIFDNANYTFDVSENKPPGYIVGQISATSSDGQEVLLTIINGNNLGRFAINSTTGIITTTTILNYENVTEYVFTVEASTETEDMSNSSIVNIYVTNVDDVSPVCESYSYHVYVSDDTPPDPVQPLLRLTCYDIDSVSLLYVIQSGNDQGKFNLSGEELFLISALNYTQQTSYTLSISVFDNFTIPQLLKVRVVVVPDPELPPVFTQDGRYSLALFENSPLGDIFQVSLTVYYTSSLDVIQYSLISGDQYNQFLINSSTGVLSLRSSLDREHVSSYTLSIMAFDKSVHPIMIRTALATMMVTVLDVNDNNPTFTPDSLTITISIDTPQSSPIFTLICSDLDSGENSTIASYSLTNDYIQVESSSGVVSTTDNVFPLGLGPLLVHQINVECVDAGTPTRTGSAVLEITVRQSNSHSPQFSDSFLTFEFEENTFVTGRSLFQVTASDDDTDLEGAVLYSLTGGADMNLFFLPVSELGYVHTVLTQFDRESRCCYDLQITAIDRAVEGFQMSSTVSVSLNITDENDNTPTFVQFMYFATIFENNTAGMDLPPVQCNDPDSGNNGYIVYSLSYNPNDLLSVDPGTGAVFLNSPIRLGSNPSILLTFYITCEDMGVPPLSSIVSYSVQIAPLDQHAPMFEHDAYIVSSLPESSLPETFVVQVRATDQDAINAGRQIEYRISSGIGSDHFTIGLISGNITVNGQLNASLIAAYNLIVIATDPTSTLVDEASVTIYLFDINEHAPVEILFVQLNISILENSPPGIEIALFVCRDIDDILPDNITYSIIDPMDALLAEFIINANGSVLTGPNSADCETRDVYDLIIICSDNEVPPLTAQRTIRIRIDGVNEYSPYYTVPNKLVYIDETVPLYTTILTIDAMDDDCGIDGDIRTYEITSDLVFEHIVLPWFAIAHDGRIYTTEYINSDILPSRVTIIIIEVVAYDNGDPSLSTLDSSITFARLTIGIINTNDKTPVFNHINPILIQLPENYPSAQVFFTVTCSDPDGLDEVSILPLGNPEPFSVMNGSISVTPGQIIDYELMRQYTFNLNCSDTMFSTSIEVRILIQPRNDHPIHFESNFYSFSLSRTATIGEVIGSVIIIDGDMGGTDLPEVIIRNTTEDDNPLTVNQLGLLSLSAALDEILLAKLDEVFYLDIFCSDGMFNDTTLVEISLVQGNLNSPRFLQTIYFFDIFEVTPPSSRIGMLDCIDIDMGSNGEVEYEISNSFPQIDFDILPDGTLQVMNPLNASQISGYNLLITCRDRGSPVRSNTTTVSISVTGGNNCPPEFIDTHTYYANISEDASVGSFVGQVFTSDCDLGENGIATYLTLSHTNQFTVSSADGKIFVRGSLDREIEEVIHLKIQAKDTYFNTSQVFTILLLDVNDNPPQCSPTEYHVTLSETAPDGAFVEEFMCYDSDTGPNGEFSYAPHTTDSPFFLMPNGSVYLQNSTLLTSALDHEYSVVVTDNGQDLQLSTQIVLYVSVAPENNFSPQFTQSNVSISISEVTLLGSLIYTFFAIDDDVGYFESKVTYAIKSGNIGRTFQIHPDEGRLTLNSYLDFTRTSQYLLVVSASDSAALSPMTSLAMITISVDEENRFFPVCNSPQYIVYVSEERLVGEITQLDCTDEDGADLVYSIDSGNLTLFEINSTSGSLFLINILDYESRTNHSLSIMVSDGVLSIYVAFQILVSPVNEFPPLFPSTVYSFSFSEDMAIPSILTTLLALDSDRDNLITKHGQVEYMIESGNEKELFTIGRANGILFLNEMLDFEVKSFYNLTIVAMDLADMSLSSSCLVYISVDNINDVQPSFNDDFYIFIINTTHQFSTPIGQVICSDLDFAPNSTQLELSFTTQTNSFSLHPQSGLITLAVNISQISQSYVDLTVSCSDGSLFEYSQIHIFIVQDSPAIGLVQSVYPFTVSESLSVGSFIGQISLDGPVTSVDFSLSVNNSFFSIDSNGNISLASSLDYELQSAHSFSVELSNDNFLTLSVVNVIVTVNDSNDNSPSFRNPLITLSMEESLSEGTPLEQIYCEDFDSSSNGETFLVISSGNEDGYFSLSTSGSFQLNKSIDYEVIADNPIIRIQVTCYDKGVPPNSVTTNVTYYVLPSNEHGPVFQDTPFNFSLREDTAVGTSIFNVTAIDPDRGADHNIVDYQIIDGNIDNTFLISPTTGEIQLVKSLDHETLHTYLLSVVAIDKERMQAGNVDLSQFTDTETISIEVLDVNDHAPEFSDTFYLATVDAGILSDTFVHSVTCNDVDDGASFSPRFSLTGSGSDLFSISSSPNTGVIKTNATISYQSSPSYLLTIFCFDNGEPVLSDQSSILITVIIINQFCPVFTESIARVQLSEATIIGSFVLRLNATYPNGDEDDVTFVLVSSLNNLFRINQTSGDIYTTGLLDFEAQRIFTLEILATNPSSTCNNTANVLIDLTNVNEYSPQFSQSYFTAAVSEAAHVGTNILFLSCSDSDDFAMGISPNVFIESGNFDNKFSVDSQRLVLSSSLDIETKQNYSLGINCTDNGSEERYTIAIVSISLLSANEFSPLFQDEVYEVSISESATVGTEILTLVATDGDDYGHNAIMFSIVSGDDSDKFFLNSDKLLLFDSLDFETQFRYTLNISVADSINPAEALYSYALVNIILIDENDNSPVLLPAVAFINLLDNTSVGTNILQLSCSDPDVFQNSSLVLDIESGNTNGQFSLSSSNQLQLASPLQLNTQRLYSLTISCKDNSSSPKLDSSNIKINVVNTILEQIVFLNTPYAVVVADTSPVGYIVLAVSATDPDSNSSDHLRYSLDNLAEVPFLIDSVSGEIQTTESLLPFSLETLTLEIRVVDESMPTRIQFEVAYVTINRTINSPPIFQSDSYFVNISELAPPSTLISTLSCSDNENDTVEYSIESGNFNDSFILAPLSGVLAVKSVLDFESMNMYVLTVSCLDDGIAPQSATARVIISVDPENEFTPVFSLTVYGPIFLNEDVLPGVDVVTVTAVDSDSDEDGEVSYTIIEGNSKKHFIIGGSSGRIRVAQFLDFEQVPTYELKIEARDSSLENPRSSTATVIIGLTDINDNCPQFIDAPYFTQLPNSAAANLTVIKLECSDLDSGERGRVSISLGGTVEALQDFQIDSDGVVSLSRNISVDSSQVYFLTPTCSDHAPAPCTVTTTLTITSANSNLSPPVFAAASYTVDIPENYPVLNVIFTANATDTDIGTNGIISYSFVNPQIEFSIDSETGEVYLSLPLDFESSTSHTVNILATDGTPLSPNRRSSTTLLTVAVTNINDNRPNCGSTLFSVLYPDSATVGYQLIQLNCTDPDQGPLGLSYSLSAESNNLFSISNDGILTVANPVSFDVTITVSVSDNFIENSVQVTNVTIMILLVGQNNFCPQFSQFNYSQNISESSSPGQVVLIVTAQDGDTGVSGVVDYAIIDGNHLEHFAVEESTGELVLISALDRESVASYSLLVRASDSGLPFPCSNDTLVTLIVTDSNDNEPCLSRPFYSETIPLSTPINSLVLSISSQDGDIGINSDMLYSLHPVNSPPAFSIHPTSGDITLTQNISNSSIQVYHYLIWAVDKGTPPLSCSSFLTLYTLQQNVYSPVFDRSQYLLSISENVFTNNNTLTYVSASDSDSEYIIYSITSGNEDRMFYLHPDTGVLSLSHQLDHEDKSLYTLTVEARDVALFSGVSLADYSQISITVTNENDNTPAFEFRSYSVAIDSAINIGDPVLTVVCTDSDLPPFGNSTLSISNGNAGGYFSLNQSGVITLTREVTTFQQELLTLSCSDGELSAHTTVLIVATSSDGPHFSQSVYEWYIEENSQLGTSYTQIYVLDSNTSLSYDIVSGNNIPIVSIDSIDATIYLINPIDRELTTDYTLTLSAYSSGSIIYSILHVIVTDINDNTPVISTDTLAQLYPYSVPGSVITFLTCQDIDSDDNAVTNLSISAGNEGNLFTLSNGVLLLDKTLGSQPVYSLTVSCSDSGLSPLSSTTVLNIEIMSVNRYSPEFEYDQLFVDVFEDTIMDSILVILSAVDRDEGRFGDVFYRIIAGNELNLFRIDPSTGELSLISSLDFESAQTHRITVSATDGGYGSVAARSSTADVTIRVFDINDNPPYLESDIYSLHISLNTARGTDLLSVTCTDADSGNNGDVVYRFVNESAPLAVYNGSIFLALSLENSITNFISLTLECRDKGFPSLVTSAVLYIVISKDELAPEFSQTTYSLPLSELAELNTEIIIITAEDRDEGNNGIVSYQLVYCSFDCPFSIHSITGVVSLIGPLDYETRPFYSLRVQALDIGTFSHTSEATLEIRVINENDNLPHFINTLHTASVSEDSATNTPVLSLHCYDLDMDTLNISITAGLKDTNAFRISSDGILLVSDQLDFETTSFYSLTVQCSDGRDTMYSVAQVSITNVNEFTPTFNQTRYSVSVPESLTFGSVIISVSAVDGDADSLGEITYSLVGGNTQQTFGILSTMGTVFLTDSLDYETTPAYSLILFATDKDGQVGRTVVDIQVININDNSPKFAPSIYSRVLSTDENVGLNIIELHCSDEDGDVLAFNIESGNTGNYFNVSQSGLVAVSRNLTGSNPVLILRISCSDMSTQPLAVAIFSINIIRDSDCGIRFSNDAPYLAHVSEDVSIGHLVLTLVVNGSSNDVTFRLEPTSVPFYVDSVDSSARVRVLNTLDADSQDQYTFNVIATPNDVSCDNPPQTSVTILVDDVNEFSPLVTPSIKTLFLEENLPTPRLVTQFQCNDSDVSNIQVTFLDSLADDSPINIDVNGRVTLNIYLDYEFQQLHTFLIMCKDSAVRPKTGTAMLYIRVTPQNEFAPSFSFPSYQFEVLESVLPGYSVGRISATDGDSSLSGDGILSYSLANTTQFTVSENGDVLVSAVLDRESVANIILLGFANDNGNISMSASVSIVITVLDSNDNPPLFHPLVISVSREYNQSVTDPIAAVRCTDLDEGSNAQLELEFAAGFNYSYSFSEQTGGQGEINASLVALSPPSEGLITFEIVCADSGNTSLSSTALVSILVSRECYSPQLSPMYHATFPEDIPTGTIVVRPSAQFDPLCPHEFHILYGQVGAFAINKTEGYIYVTNPLDFETLPAYEISISLISLTSTGAKSFTASVFITLTNVNDNSPVIEPALLTLTLPENTPVNHVIADYSCSDVDHDSLEFSKSGDLDAKFNLDGQGVLTLLNSLDFEVIRVYDLSISCYEVAASGTIHTTTAQLVVLVSAVNDNEPSFDQSTYTDTVSENTAIGTTVLSVSASDNDLTTPHNKTLFTLSGANSHLFRVTSEGSLVTADFLDAETSFGIYQFSVLAYNPAPGVSTATAVVRITLTDVNEDPPVCGGGVINLVLEPGVYTSQSVGGTLVCTDTDISPPSFTATLNGDFGNDPTLTLSADLFGSSLSLSLSGTVSYPNHVTPNKYTLSVSDGGTPPMTGDTVVYIRVNPPPGALSFVPSSRTISVGEDFPLGYELVDVGALLTGNDKDFASYSTSFPLSVTSDGVVTLSSSLDHETLTFHSVEIRAEVSSQFNTFTLNIQVTDYNDNEPVFPGGNILRLTVREDTSPSVVTTLTASDADSGTNGAVTFSPISGTGLGIFSVSESGVVRLAGFLDREETAQYSIQVRASDRGFPSLSAVAVIFITISDVNDNPPIFLEDSSGLVFSVEHTIPKGNVIHTFQVTDLDLNPTFTFSVIGSAPASAAFGVNSAGELYILDDLVNIPSQTFEFTVTVSDGLSTDSISVRVLVSLVADVELTLVENSPIGTVVWDAFTFSKESYVPTGSAQFFLVLGNFQNKFEIGSNNGLLANIGEIDYEDTHVYTFLVEIDDATNPVSTNLKVSVYLLVEDENDNSPEFTLLAPSVVILESDYITPYLLAQVSANDLDSGLYAQLEYHLIYPETGQEASELPFYFTFDGSLFAQGEVDREMYSLLDLLIRVRDKSETPLSTTAPVQIAILDVNDNPPSFVDLISSIEIINNFPDNHVFYEFNVSDPDAGDNGTIQMSLTQLTNPSSTYFDFSLEQGLVKLIKTASLLGLSEDELFYIDLRLTLMDMGSPQLKHSQNFTVAVKPFDIRPSFQSDMYWVDLLYSAPIGTELLTLGLEVELDSIYFLLDAVDENDFMIDRGGTLYSVKDDKTDFDNYHVVVTARNQFGGKESSTNVIVNTLTANFIAELLLNISYQDFIDNIDDNLRWLDDQVPPQDTFQLVEYHIQDGIVNVSLYVKQGVYYANNTNPGVSTLGSDPKPFLQVETICDLYFSDLKDVLECRERYNVDTVEPEQPMSLIWILAVFVVVILLLLVCLLLLCLGAYIYYKRQEEKILMDESIFDHPYMIARPLGAYEMQEELLKLGKRGRGKPSMVRSYNDEERAYQLGRGREYHSSDENIDETFMNEYASSESSISVYGQDYSQFEQMETWQKYRNMGPLLRQMVERWREGDNIILEDDESKGEMSA